MKTFQELINEISYEPVDVNWFYQKDGDWFGEFDVDSISYDIAIKREGRDKTDLNVVFIKFAKDFNKPMVVANTVAVSLKDYIKTEKINILVFKAYAKENTRVDKYRTVSSLLSKLGFTFRQEIVDGDYVYFCLFRSSSDFKNKDVREFISKL